MYKLIRLFNQNRKVILVSIIAIVFVIGIIQFLNGLYKDQKEDKINEILNKNIEIVESTYEPSYSITTGTIVSKSTNQKSENIISQFIENCNKGKIEEAYKLLSDDCREEVYPTLDIFKKYYNQNFKTKKNFTMQLWISYPLTYKVELIEDALSSGKISNNSVLQDFYTIVKDENGENKLNISEYIGKEEIGKSIYVKNIYIKVNYKNVYKNYEVYNITIENKTKNTIKIDSRESTKTMYLEESNSIKYYAYAYELDDNNYIIKTQHKNTFNLKYEKNYNKDKKDYAIVFGDIIMDYDKYKETNNKKDYKDRIAIRLSI